MNSSKIKWYSLFFAPKTYFILSVLIACLVISAFLGYKTPHLIADVSKFFDQGDLFNQSLISLTLNFTFIYLNRVIYQLSVNKYVRVIIQFARTEGYRRWILTPNSKSEKYSQGEIISRIISDTESIRELVTSGTFGIFIDLSFVFSCLISFMTLDSMLGISTAFFELILTIGLIWGSKLMRDVFSKLRNAQAAVNRITSNVTGGFFQIYYENHHQYSSKKSDFIFDDFLKKQNQANVMDAFYYAIAESMYPIILAFLAVILPFKSTVTVALLFALIDLIQRSINPLKEISGKISNIQRAMAGIERVEQFYNDLNPIESNAKDEIHDKFESLNIDLEKFSYHSKNERKNFELGPIKFNGKQGELIGLIGLSGCGKSTLLNLLGGNLKAAMDATYIQTDQRKVRIGDLDYLKYVSLISQDSHIFSENLKFNLFFKENIETLEETKFRQILESIDYMRNNFSDLDKVIVPSKLSAGEKQLLAGVRAVLLNKPVVLIDEISSAMDSKLEKALRELILLVQKNALTIIVAHRVETIISADRIQLMENGRVLQSGKHDFLLETSSTYRQFMEQLSHS